MEEKLIEAVREHRELYDCKDPNYMKINLKNRIWNEIAKDLDLKDGEEAKNLWLKLRANYRDARRRQTKCMKSGAAPENIKPWRLQNQMSFLDPLTTGGTREGNISSEIEDSPQPTVVEDTPMEDDGGEESEANVVPQTPSTSADPTTQSRTTKSKRDDIRSIMKRSIEMREQRARERQEERKTLKSNTLAEDPLYNFFISMYQLTKKMPPNYQHTIRNKLFMAVSQAEEELLNISSRPPLTFSPQSSASSPMCSPAQHPSPQCFSDSQQHQSESDIIDLSNFVTTFRPA